MRALPVFILLGGWLAQSAQAADAQDWLKRLTEAELRQSFHGAFIYERNGSFTTHELWRKVESSGEVRERLLQLDGPAQEVVRVNGQTWCVSSTLSDQLPETQAWPSRSLDTAALAQWYDLRLVGESRVAGRPAVVLSLSPRDQHRYGFELHLDRDTGLPLKSLLLGDKGQLLERLQFTWIDTKDAPADGSVQPSQACEAVRVTEAPRGQKSRWRSEWLPPGFSLASEQERRSPASSDSVSWLVYDDGLSRFSVFLEPLHGAVVEDARSQLGPTVMVAKRVSTADGDVMVTVVGEIPLGTAERVALSMRAAEAPAAQ
ncbi:MucB/RseB C-terminal domain-containing protein [Metapseudomonas boanensis]|uniref:MucB/RseB C-terminal domain-containing protein n=1 Tax=Metapseudomonas boanensis TaxID=2822138 RepID=A0ABS5XGJ5_9GAMM|nr:MucB/RseB C-terminal domain-containing protein [Pseudomonas boanensis]MBT8766813.1 MucB/RseB C-terminal domain-containing protein [Pseudomonas boanensis]